MIEHSNVVAQPDLLPSTEKLVPSIEFDVSSDSAPPYPGNPGHKHLAEPLGSKPGPKTQNAIIQAIWHPSRYSPAEVVDWDVFFDSYTSLLSPSILSVRASHHMKTHQDVVRVLGLIREHKSKEGICKTIMKEILGKQEHGRNRAMITAMEMIDRAATLLTTFPINDWLLGRSQTERLQWTGGSLKGSIAGYFHRDMDQQVELHDKYFRACNFEPLAGINIEWTDTLLDHLRLTNRDRTVKLFRRFVFLTNYPEGKQDDQFPEGFIIETLQTLSVLFPSDEEESRAFLESSGATHAMDIWGPLSDGDWRFRRRTERFKYWGERLNILKETFDHSSSRTMKGLWRDKRNPDRWFNSWLAITAVALTLLFVFIQSIEGAIQVYKAYHPTPAPS